MLERRGRPAPRVVTATGAPLWYGHVHSEDEGSACTQYSSRRDIFLNVLYSVLTGDNVSQEGTFCFSPLIYFPI